MPSVRPLSAGSWIIRMPSSKPMSSTGVDWGRDDVLKWVGVYRNDRNRTVYRIWTIPGTRRLASVCPFLEHEPTENHWLCQIHEVKPTICRNYPVSRKHALMTGCPGFKYFMNIDDILLLY